MRALDAVEAWEGLGRRIEIDGDRVFIVDRPATTTAVRDPIVVLHGFPSCSYDWAHVLERLGAQRRVVLVDFLGFGLSDKPDRPYSLFQQADRASAVVAQLGIERVALLSHDMGDSVGGELLARDLDGTLPFAITQRALTNGSIYLDLAELTAGQEMLRAAPDERLPPGLVTEEGFGAGLAATFGADTQPSGEDLAIQWAFMHRHDGERLLARIIRYLNERAVHESRWTGAIETHPAPLAVVWGALDPVAVEAMAHRLVAARRDASLEILEGIGHYPMVEAPERFANACLSALDTAR